jgi:transcriptional regulator with XRE-family HTH domain
MTVDDTTPEFKGSLRRALKTRGMSQAELARAANLPRAEISRMASRGMRPTPPQARKIAEILEPTREGSSCRMKRDGLQPDAKRQTAEGRRPATTPLQIDLRPLRASLIESAPATEAG